MQTITADYTKELEMLPTLETLDLETRALRSLYRYEDGEVRSFLDKVPRARAWRPNTMFMFFEFEGDAKQGRFVNPLDVKPAFDQAPRVCKLDFELKAMHVDEMITNKKLTREMPLEHRLFARAPLTVGAHTEWTDWIVCSGIEVFAERIGRDKRLQAFLGESMPTKLFASQEAVQIEKGRVKLSHGLWAHTKTNMFTRFFEPVMQIFEAPLVACAGIPTMVPKLARFINRLMAEYTRDAELVDLWQTKSLDFTIAKSVEGAFALRPGYWTVVDTDYVFRNQDLEGHKIDIDNGTFELLDRNDNPIDAAYVVNRIHLEPQTTVH